MTDEEEFYAAPSSNERGKATDGYCSIAAGEWAGWSPTPNGWACGDQSRAAVSAIWPT
jgi:hypothetical protein